MPITYVLRSGLAGGVKFVAATNQADPTGGNPGGAALIAELHKWAFPGKLTPLRAVNFGSPTDANGNVWGAVYKGSAEGQVEVEGHYDTFSNGINSNVRIAMGKYYYLDLLIDRTVPFGYKNLFCLCTDFAPEVDADNKITGFRAKFEVSADSSGTSVPTAPTGAG